MSFSEVPLFLLPPRPALRDWPVAGACAGLLLGLAELLHAATSRPPPTLAILGVMTLALGLALAAFAVGLAHFLLRLRPSRSALVGWVSGLLGVAALAPLALPRPEASGLATLAVLLIAALATAGVAFAAAQLADRSERTGTPANALLCWGTTAAVVAASERVLLGEPVFGGLALALLAGVLLAGAGAAAAVFALTRRRRSSRPTGSFTRLFAGLAALSLAVAQAPSALPWLLADHELPVHSGVPANILILALGPGAELAGWSGIRYEPLVPEPERALEALLTLPDGAALVPALASDGYRTAAILADPTLGQEVGAREVDARPGGRLRLERDLRWLAVAPWLAGPGRRALEQLGLGDAVRPPGQLASDARGWLLQRGASQIPFFLLVDFRGLAPASGEGSTGEEEAVSSLLEHLGQVGLADRTVVVLAQTGGPRERPLRVLVRPPLTWPGPAGSEMASRPVEASEIGAALRQIAHGDGATPIPFPGIVGIPPAARMIAVRGISAAPGGPTASSTLCCRALALAEESV